MFRRVDRMGRGRQCRFLTRLLVHGTVMKRVVATLALQRFLLIAVSGGSKHRVAEDCEQHHVVEDYEQRRVVKSYEQHYIAEDYKQHWIVKSYKQHHIAEYYEQHHIIKSNEQSQPTHPSPPGLPTDKKHIRTPSTSNP